jgi:hypothetical protein
VVARQKVLEPLYKIKNKFGFNLSIEISQRQIRLNQWPDIFSTFQPVLEHFEKEGAHVRVRFCYDSKERNNPPVMIDLNDLFPHNNPAAWKTDVIAELENVC